MNTLKILFVSSEVRPFAMTGGLGDVAGALPKYLKKMGHDVRVVMPAYGMIDKTGFERMIEPLGVPTGEGEKWCGILKSTLPQSDVPIYFIENNSLFDRAGIYGDPKEFGDNLLRYTVLSRGSLQLCHYLNWFPDVIHANDWQTATIPAYINSIESNTQLKSTATVLTIHNLGYQGEFSSESYAQTGLPWEFFNHLGFENYKAVNLLKGGIYHSTIINTVSTTYAHEIQTPQMGFGMDGILRQRGAHLYGVLNGIDEQDWDPMIDPHLPAHFNVDSLSGKKTCKKELQKELGLEQRDDVPLIAMITRLANQKGIDIVAQAIYKILEMDVQFVLVGTGQDWAEHFFSILNNSYKGKFKAVIDFNTPLAHRVEAGADLFLMPSRYEPCGLNQIYSLRYGTLPIVRSTGGLADTVINYDEKNGTGTGFKLWDLSGDSVLATTTWAVETYYNRPKHFKNMQKEAMNQLFTWSKAARNYDELYNKAVYLRRALR
jgi:starch synthase